MKKRVSSILLVCLYLVSASFFFYQETHAGLPKKCSLVLDYFKKHKKEKEESRDLLISSLDELNYLTGFLFYKGSISSERKALERLSQGVKASYLHGIIHRSTNKREKELQKKLKVVNNFDFRDLKNSVLLDRYTEKLLDSMVDPKYLKSKFFTQQYPNLLAIRTHQFNLLRNMLSDLVKSIESKPNSFFKKTKNAVSVASGYIMPLVYLRTYMIIKEDLQPSSEVAVHRRSRARHFYSIFRATANKTIGSVSALAVASALYFAVDANIDYKKAQKREQTEMLQVVSNNIVLPYKAENIAQTKYLRYLSRHKEKFKVEANEQEKEIYWQAAQVNGDTN